MPAYRSDHGLLNVSAWIRGQPWLMSLYRLIPSAWRANALRAAISPPQNSLRFDRTPAWERHAESVVPLPDIASMGTVGPGLNVFGYLRGEFGLAESARMYSRALVQGGFKVALNDINLGLSHGWHDSSLDPWIVDDAPYSSSIFFVNPDFIGAVLKKAGLGRDTKHRIIACWFWELEAVPEAWLPAIGMVDQIIVASTFIETAFRKITDKPISRVPLPLYSTPDSGLQREDFGLEADKFIFLCAFDFHSSIERKNPFAAITAFQLAFPRDRNDVSLLIKSSSGQWAPQQLRRLLDAAAADPRISVRDDLIAKEHVQALQRCCDAYVSLHRAEGFGLGIAECMAQGKPVIATAWSGNMDFMDAGNSILVDYRLVPIAAGDYPHAEGARWADPDVKAAAAAMIRLVDEPGLAERLGQSASKVKEKLSQALVARELGALLDRPYPHCERSIL